MKYAKIVDYVCDECGSENIYKDATATWSVAHQRMVLASTQDNGWCEDCGYESGSGVGKEIIVDELIEENSNEKESQ